MKWKKIKKRIRHRAEYILARFVMGLVQRMSLPRALRLGDRIGAFVFDGLKIRRRVAVNNIGRAFPEMDEAQRQAVARRSFQNIAKMALEFVRFPVLSDQEVRELVEFEGLEHFDALMAEHCGAPLVTGHFGNWELMGAALAVRGYPVTFVAKAQKNKLVDHYINDFRRGKGAKIVHLGIGIRQVIKALRNQEFAALVSDQDARKHGIFVDFFGIPSSTHASAAALALKNGTPVIFGSCFRQADGHHRVVVERIDTAGYEGGATAENIHAVTQAYTAALEAAIRRAPDHYFWVHRRWKSKPKSMKTERHS